MSGEATESVLARVLAEIRGRSSREYYVPVFLSAADWEILRGEMKEFMQNREDVFIPGARPDSPSVNFLIQGVPIALEVDRSLWSQHHV